MSDMSKMLRPLRMAIGNMIARGTVSAVNAANKMQGLQMRLLAGEVKDDIEHFEPYGFTSNPGSGAEGVALFLDGDRSHGIVICVADRRYRLKGLKTGEVALSDDLGQKVHLTRDGIVVDGAGKNVTFQNAPIVTMTGDLRVNGNVIADCDVFDHTTKSMAGMRSAYNGHKNGAGTTTPDTSM